MLEEDAIRFDTFLKENDKKAHEAIKKAERETKVHSTIAYPLCPLHEHAPSSIEGKHSPLGDADSITVIDWQTSSAYRPDTTNMHRHLWFTARLLQMNQGYCK